MISETHFNNCSILITHILHHFDRSQIMALLHNLREGRERMNWISQGLEKNICFIPFKWFNHRNIYRYLPGWYFWNQSKIFLCCYRFIPLVVCSNCERDNLLMLIVWINYSLLNTFFIFYTTYFLKINIHFLILTTFKKILLKPHLIYI